MLIFVHVQVEDPGLRAGQGSNFNHPDEKVSGQVSIYIEYLED
jgi:hypothetical protein